MALRNNLHGTGSDYMMRVVSVMAWNQLGIIWTTCKPAISVQTSQHRVNPPRIIRPIEPRHYMWNNMINKQNIKMLQVNPQMIATKMFFFLQTWIRSINNIIQGTIKKPIRGMQPKWRNVKTPLKVLFIHSIVLIKINIKILESNPWS